MYTSHNEFFIATQPTNKAPRTLSTQWHANVSTLQPGFTTATHRTSFHMTLSLLSSMALTTGRCPSPASRALLLKCAQGNRRCCAAESHRRAVHRRCRHPVLQGHCSQLLLQLRLFSKKAKEQAQP